MVGCEGQDNKIYSQQAYHLLVPCVQKDGSKGTLREPHRETMRPGSPQFGGVEFLTLSDTCVTQSDKIVSRDDREEKGASGDSYLILHVLPPPGEARLGRDLF